MNMIELYHSLLETAGMTASNDGSVSIYVGKHKEPMTVRGLRLVLPTREQMKNADWSNRIAFQILNENVLKGETEVFSVYRKALVRKLNLSLCMIAAELIHIAASPALHKKLNPAQSKFLLGMQDADEKTLATFKKLVDKMPVDDPNRSIVSVYMKRNGAIDKVRYPRVGVVSFPLYEELSESDNSVWGLKTRVKDMATLRSLLEYMIPGLGDGTQTYDVGSNCTIAPYTTALMRTMAGLIAVVNDLLELHWGRDSEMWETCSFNTDWLDLVEDLTPIQNEIRLTPNQNTQEEAAPVATPTPQAPAQPQTTQSAPVASVTTQPVAPQPMAPQPVVQPTAVQTQYSPPVQPQMQAPVQPQVHQQQPTKPGNSIDDIIGMKYRSMGLNPPPAQTYAPVAPVATGYGQPQPVFVGYDNYGRPVYQQPQPQMGFNGWPVQPQVPTQPQYAPAQGAVYTGQVGSHGYPVRG